MRSIVGVVVILSLLESSTAVPDCCALGFGDTDLSPGKPSDFIELASYYFGSFVTFCIAIHALYIQVMILLCVPGKMETAVHPLSLSELVAQCWIN